MGWIWVNTSDTIFDSSFKVGDSANIYKVELEPNKNGKSKVRFYLEDDRVITEELNQLEW